MKSCRHLHLQLLAPCREHQRQYNRLSQQSGKIVNAGTFIKTGQQENLIKVKFAAEQEARIDESFHPDYRLLKCESRNRFRLEKHMPFKTHVPVENTGNSLYYLLWW